MRRPAARPICSPGKRSTGHGLRAPDWGLIRAVYRDAAKVDAMLTASGWQHAITHNVLALRVREGLAYI